MKRKPELVVLATLIAAVAGHSAAAQDLANGRRLSERWCTECHVIGAAGERPGRAFPFAAIAAKPSVNADMIAAFLMMPHATMPNPPLSRNDARDIAAFIMAMKK
ncbi:MAG TPA: cytochrome c [Tardiphaga sp.]